MPIVTKQKVKGEIALDLLTYMKLYEPHDLARAVFVGLDEGKPRYTALRGTWQHMSNLFKGEVAGSNKRFSFSVQAENSSHLYFRECY